jgi:hypothetical protein
VQVSLIENHANFCPFKALRKASIFSKTSCAHGVIAISIFSVLFAFLHGLRVAFQIC